MEISYRKSGRKIVTIDEIPTKKLKILTPFGSNKFGVQKLVFNSGSELVPIENKYKEWKFIPAEGEEVLLSGKWMIKFQEFNDIFIVSTPYKGFDYGDWALIYLDEVNPYRSDQWLYTESLERRFLNKKKWAKYKRKKRSASERNDDNDDEDNIMRGLGSGNGDLLGF